MDPYDKDVICHCRSVFQHNIIACNGNSQNQDWVRQLAENKQVEKQEVRNATIAAILLKGDARHMYTAKNLLESYPRLCIALNQQMALFYSYVRQFAHDYEQGTLEDTHTLLGEANLIMHILGNLSHQRTHRDWFSTGHTNASRLTIKMVQDALPPVTEAMYKAFPVLGLFDTTRIEDTGTKAELQLSSASQGEKHLKLGTINDSKVSSSRDLHASESLALVESPLEIEREIGPRSTGVKSHNRNDSGIDTADTKSAADQMTEKTSEDAGQDTRKDSGISETMIKATRKQNDHKRETQSIISDKSDAARTRVSNDGDNTSGSPSSPEGIFRLSLDE